MPLVVLFGQLVIGLINGAFYAMLSLGLAVIFGMLHIVNFAHGALYMLGGFFAWLALTQLGIGYWTALFTVPLVIGLLSALIERTMLRRLVGLDPIYGLLLTFGLARVIQGMFRYWFGSSGRPYSVPSQLQGGVTIGAAFVPIYGL